VLPLWLLACCHGGWAFRLCVVEWPPLKLSDESPRWMFGGGSSDLESRSGLSRRGGDGGGMRDLFRRLRSILGVVVLLLHSGAHPRW
jgi:hypothetical protein